MPLAPGTRLGPYEIVAALGAGGMGEVYRARDTRLERTVALKVLPPDQAGDAERQARFEREARAISALNHPHICTLHDVGHQDGLDFLVMEHVEGQTLADRLRGGALPFDLVLRHGMEIAGALDKAHRLGIVHRDLKPSNVMLTKTGAKLLDFGLAKLGAGPGADPTLSSLQTQEKPLTGEGRILGTIQYMAPEQLEGGEADARTDIFALGTLLYEMSTGQRAFTGKSQASLIGAILRDPSPSIAATQPLAPPALDRVVGTCLKKDPDERWQSARDVATELRWIADTASAGTVMPSPGRSRRERVAWLAAAGFGLALAGTLGALARARARTPAEARLVRFNVLPPENARLGPFALSPDGRQLAFVAKSSAGSSLWVRPLDSLEPRPLAGTEGADLLFWSPDSRSIGFLTGRELKTIEAAGGPARSLAELRIEGRGGTWSRDGVIVYAHLDEPLYRISESGGQPSPVTRLDTSRKERGHRFPHFLPDGRHFLFYSRGAPGGLGEGVRLGSLDSLDSQPLFAAQTSVAYAPPGYVLFARQGTLLAQAFDAASGRLSGEPLRLFEGLRHEGEEGRTGYAAFSVSQTGVIAWRAGREDANRLEWSDRNGARVATAAPPGVYDEPSLSPDGRRLAVNRTDPQTRQREVWVLDLLRGALSRLTFEPGAGSPVWSPDGSRIAYASDASGFEEIRWLSAVGSGEGGPLVGAPKGRKYPVDWSPDGRFLVYECADPGTTDDLWLLPLGEPAEPRPFLRTPFSETGAQVSPDGRWIAYTSDESGEYEVYVQPFPEGGAKVQVSVGGGEQPGWRRDGKELFYVSPQRELVAAELKPGPGFDTSAPRPLFDLPVRVGRAGFAKQYAVAPDGRFLLNALVGGGADSMTVVLDWPALLGR